MKFNQSPADGGLMNSTGSHARFIMKRVEKGQMNASSVFGSVYDKYLQKAEGRVKDGNHFLVGTYS